MEQLTCIEETLSSFASKVNRQGVMKKSSYVSLICEIVRLEYDFISFLCMSYWLKLNLMAWICLRVGRRTMIERVIGHVVKDQNERMTPNDIKFSFSGGFYQEWTVTFQKP
jgi:hypothetical protein